MIELYNHQLELKRDIYAAIRLGNRKVMVKAPTGLGKTVLSADIIHDAVSKGIRAIFTVPTLTLIDQTLTEFTKFGLECGVQQGDHFATDYSKPVQIVSIQTIASQLKRNSKAQMFQMEQYFKDTLILFDEAHQRFAAMQWLMDATRKPCLGMSASPWSKNLGLQYDAIIHGKDVSWLIDNGYLSKFRVYAPSAPDMSGVSTGANGDYSHKQSGEKYTPKVVGEIVGHWERLAKGRQSILFAPRVSDAERFANEFRLAGYSAQAVSGYQDNSDCRIEIDKFRNHETMILCSVSKISTGFNVTDVSCIIDARPTKSLMVFVQSLGRGLRTAAGKEDCIILDHAGNHERCGMLTGDFPTTLDMGADGNKNDRKKKDEPLPKPCSKCGAMKEPKVHTCPACGFAPERQSMLSVEAGELVELKSAMAKRNRDDRWEDKIKFISELNAHANNKKYKRGWVVNQYKQRYSVLPWDSRLKNVPNAEIISEATQKWIISQQIRFANRRVP